MFFVVVMIANISNGGDECPQKKAGSFRGQPSGWVYVEGESSGVSSAKLSTTKEIKQDIARTFRFLACISEEQDLEISLNVTFRKGKENASSWAYV